MNDKRGYLLMESSISSKPKVIQDTASSVTFVANLQESSAPNRNGRIYDKDALDNALRHYSVAEKLRHKTFYGEAGHPLSEDPKRQMYIDQRNISHIVTKVWWEGEMLMGEVETSATEAGRDMRGLIRQGSDVSFSMRGMSDNVTRKGQYMHVGGPILLCSYDWVQNRTC